MKNQTDRCEKPERKRAREAEGRESWVNRSILIGLEAHVLPNSSILLAYIIGPRDVSLIEHLEHKNGLPKSKYWRKCSFICKFQRSSF